MNETSAAQIFSSMKNDNHQPSTLPISNDKRKVTVFDEEHDAEFSDDDNSDDDSNEFPTPEQLSEFFKATEEGSVDRLEELFESIPNADPNMTQYTESLLMTAIRSKRSKAAEYLIDQIGVDVKHNSELYEFRPQTRMPVRHRPFTCRDLAYDRGMMDLVDLIDLTSDEIRPSTKRFLQKRLKNRLDEIHQSYLKRMKEGTNPSIIPAGISDNLIVEEELEIKENEEVLPTPSIDRFNRSSKTFAPPISTTNPSHSRAYRSHIEETLRKIEISNEKSIEDTGKKYFQYSGYKVRFRLHEQPPSVPIVKETIRPTTSPILPRLPLASARSVQWNSSSFLTSRPKTTVRTRTARSQHSAVDLNLTAPIRENRTSICRSARRIATPRVHNELQPEEKVKSARPPSQRVLKKRVQPFAPTLSFLSYSDPPSYYNQTTRFVPVTLKSTAAGLPAGNRLIRD